MDSENDSPNVGSKNVRKKRLSPRTFFASASSSMAAVTASQAGVTRSRSEKRRMAGAGPLLGTSVGSPPSYSRLMMCEQSEELFKAMLCVDV